MDIIKQVRDAIDGVRCPYVSDSTEGEHWQQGIDADLQAVKSVDDIHNPKCDCCKQSPAEPPHECPYSEISGSTDLCNCCDGCARQCYLDV